MCLGCFWNIGAGFKAKEKLCSNTKVDGYVTKLNSLSKECKD